MKPRIVISEFIHESALQALSQHCEIHSDPNLVDDRSALYQAIQPASALIVRNRTRVNPSLLDQGPSLRCVGRLGVGLDNIDIKACHDRGIAVFPATGANTQSVAEYVIGALFALWRGVYHTTNEVIQGQWPRTQLIGHELHTRTLGLLGWGRTAQATASMAKNLGISVYATDPTVAPDQFSRLKVKPIKTLDELLPLVDALSLHIPLTEETRNILDARRLALLPKSAVVINAARGGLIDEQALIQALQTGALAGAALDVFSQEPLDAASGARFLDLRNLILTPHIAGVTHESNVRVGALVANKILNHLTINGLLRSSA